MKNIIFIAPPAAGKGTVSSKVREYYNIPHISTGDLLRDEIKKLPACRKLQLKAFTADVWMVMLPERPVLKTINEKDK